MCGIAGIYNSKLDPSLQMDGQNRMMGYMYHRGPDDSGIESFGNCILGQTRLSIIDISKQARQPFTNKRGEISITVNGEIYNYKEIRKELINRGYQFQSNSDSEVVLHGYIEWGTSLFERLRGMFAIAIYDKVKDELILSRDRLGIKPLYYSQQDGSTIFASEIGAILASNIIKSEFNISSLYSYLFLGYMPEGIVPIKNIQSVNPGSYLVIKNNKVLINAYWSMKFKEDRNFDSKEDLIKETRRLLDLSITSHTQSDVPLGVFLSGGIDSTVITGLVANQFSNVKTLSVGFEDGPSYLNELELARKTANYFGTEHSEFLLSGSHVENRIKDIIHHIDRPSFDGINTYIVSEMAKQSGLTVALSGLGGDELFGGYDIFNFYPKYLCLLPLWKKLPMGIKGGLTNILSVILTDNDRKNKIKRLKDIKNSSGFYALNRANSWPSDIFEIIKEDFHRHHIKEDLFKVFDEENDDPWKSLQEKEIKNYVTSRLLRDTDAMSMSHSLEVRVPFLDDDLLEHIISIQPKWYKVFGWPKKLLVESTKDIIPEFVLQKKKQGFQLPMEVWMRNELKHIVDDVFSSSSIRNRGFFDEKAMSELLRKFKDNKITYDQVWKFVVLELWLREHKVTI